MSQPNGGTFDIVILGAGSGGYAAALRAAQFDLSVALIDKAELGGTCLHRGCIPTKALLHAAEIADQTRESEQFGVKADLVGIDMAGVNAYKDGVVSRLFKGLSGMLSHNKNITVVQGAGKLVSKDTVEVDGKRYTGRNIILATGSYSRSLPGLEVDGKRVLTSEHALTMDRVPASAIVLGGGVIGVEFASVWKSFGADVTIVEALPRLVAAEDADISKQVERAFRKRKINFKVGKPFEKVEHTDNGVRVTIAGGETLEAEVLLVAVGRGPTTANLGYEQQGITLDRGFVIVDERLRTGVGNIYAVGDIVPGLQLAHRGFQQGIFVAEEIAGKKPAVIDEAGIPRVTYSDPEVASVGITEAKAKEQYGDDKVSTYNYNLGGNGKSQILKTAGFIKLVRVNDGPVVGVHMVGARVGELVGEAQLITNWEAFPEEVAQLVHAHPTQNEALGEAFLALAGKPLHAHS
ncbi:dihydrolipoamide dehydrogenase [Actinoplanes campanulatus]|uniref:Dihydrolipoyl dehydrogenase n=1 Tax=Actinoplanes campanulatus TaxID=113559 RepID=A0A7W5APC7_9ACTN|nr:MULTISPECIES: dihydrolipoyl dehydrogenase [Actinoplanes]MBB3099976.1 dihydrolipoamide dehydrogenase [Actinoplanes campanulatus]GGN29679.1 dihydrolipoyl dehydrogenase [Actinoplanes campanulatus]GID42214.1 dihydrolipoyl dehydrogenase [Actinoplanes campanulatus]GID44760.1 dihydrolipoyl dehydrogenase [Actinoplanes capillaceus]